MRRACAPPVHVTHRHDLRIKDNVLRSPICCRFFVVVVVSLRLLLFVGSGRAIFGARSAPASSHRSEHWCVHVRSTQSDNVHSVLHGARTKIRPQCLFASSVRVGLLRSVYPPQAHVFYSSVVMLFCWLVRHSQRRTIIIKSANKQIIIGGVADNAYDSITRHKRIHNMVILARVSANIAQHKYCNECDECVIVVFLPLARLSCDLPQSSSSSSSSGTVVRLLNRLPIHYQHIIMPRLEFITFTVRARFEFKRSGGRWRGRWRKNSLRASDEIQ